MNRLSRKNFKRVKTKASTVGNTLLTGMLMRDKSINQIMDKIHLNKKLIQRLLKLDYHCVLRLKDNNSSIIEDAEGKKMNKNSFKKFSF